MAGRRRRCIAALTLVACGPVVAVGDDTGTGGPGPTTAPPTTTREPDPSTTSAGTTSPGTTSPGTTITSVGDSSTSEANPFIIPPDHGGDVPSCDLWEEDCPPGWKCMPWASDGGSAWNDTRCTEIAPDPRAPGEPCTAPEGPLAGIDDCVLHAMCWNVDPATMMGECVGFCSGSEANPICEIPNTTCNLTGDGVLILCLPNCDPLLPDCDEGEVCVSNNETFGCAPDAGGDEGQYGDPCEFLNVCDPGLFCADAASLPSCEGSTGCCTPYCDLDAGASCPDEAAGVECVPWYEPGQAPAGYEDVGACLVPQ